MKIKEFRLSENMTQEELATKIGVTRSTVAMWEAGEAKPRVETLLSIAKIFNCTTDELLKEESV